ncbi:MAG: malate dehydrogenase [Gammaproteobacteria bacterium]|nr:malate dehydrogenase [Gammaproteobacteria bacterium]
MQEKLKQAALFYHEFPKPGKIGMVSTKPTGTQKDLALAYSPGVAEPVRSIVKDPDSVYRYTSKGNLVAVISDGTAVLGLGNVGPLASKPVMEGKAVLFKRFADIDVFDLEIHSESPKAFIDTVARLAPTFGGISLEDIKGPECFEIEEALIKRLNIPVFHDDQHGTAIIIAAGLFNALEIQEKPLDSVKIVCVGAGAAGIASMKLLVKLGARVQNIVMIDRTGIIHSGRKDLNSYKACFALDTKDRTLVDAMKGADVFIGLSSPNILTADMLKDMAERPICFALANPDPEVKPEFARSVREDLIIATGRSDYPNQVNNVLGFPYIFRGALDVRATCINDEMKIAAVYALSKLAKEPVPQEVLDAYEVNRLSFGREYIIPTPLDPRLKFKVSKAVCAAAVKSGVAKLSFPAHY